MPGLVPLLSGQAAAAETESVATSSWRLQQVGHGIGKLHSSPQRGEVAAKPPRGIAAGEGEPMVATRANFRPPPPPPPPPPPHPPPPRPPRAAGPGTRLPGRRGG